MYLWVPRRIDLLLNEGLFLAVFCSACGVFHSWNEDYHVRQAGDTLIVGSAHPSQLARVWIPGRMVPEGCGWGGTNLSIRWLPLWEECDERL